MLNDALIKELNALPQHGLSNSFRLAISFTMCYNITEADNDFAKDVIHVRIYLDMSCYNRPYDDQSQLRVAMEAQSKLHIQNLIMERKLELVGSYILDYESANNPFEMRKRAITDFLQNNMTFYVGSERDGDVSAKASEIMKGA